MLEAAALGTPVILSDIPVHRLLFYTLRDPGAMKRAIDPRGGSRGRVERARREVRSRYDLKAAGESILRLYPQIADIGH